MRHLADVIKKPVITEKTFQLSNEGSCVVFDVATTANKTEVKQAVESLFKVKVERVNIMNVKPKSKRVGRYEGLTRKRRKAIVVLKDGHKIQLLD